jgi:hypothetical protein
VVAWKPQLGHLALGADAVEAALAVRALRAGRLPGAPTPGPGHALLLLTAGFLGQTGALVLVRA